MKYLDVSAYLFCFVLLLSACNKDDEPDPNSPNTPKEDYTSLKVDGVLKEDLTSGGGFISGSNNASISGDFANNESIYIYIDSSPGSATYVLDATTDDCNYIDDTGENFSLSNPGSYLTVVITDVNTSNVIKSIIGTFEGKLYNNAGGFITITEGAFSDL